MQNAKGEMPTQRASAQRVHVAATSIPVFDARVVCNCHFAF
jgi:hypothetical protein